ncbi:hypothetical protein ISS07_04130 [Candidatus Woesearchaeota archaeon]|nr:hypothetical protein [Candidatus Woesearchaeota archaeon]
MQGDAKPSLGVQRLGEYFVEQGIHVQVGNRGYGMNGFDPKFALSFKKSNGLGDLDLGTLVVDISNRNVTGTLDGSIPKDVVAAIGTELRNKNSYFPDVRDAYHDDRDVGDICRSHMTSGTTGMNSRPSL